MRRRKWRYTSGGKLKPMLPPIYGMQANRYYTELQLAELEPKAFAALPEPYQADACLEFWKKNGRIFCQPRKEEVETLLEHLRTARQVVRYSGSWTSFFNPDFNTWMVL